MDKWAVLNAVRCRNGVSLKTDMRHVTVILAIFASF